MGNVRSVLSFGKGITNVPSDAICDDNALEECMGMVFMDGEHRVVQEPVLKLEGIGHAQDMPLLVLVHEVSNATHYIVMCEAQESRTLEWGADDNGSYHFGAFITQELPSVGEINVKAIGNTLIVGCGEEGLKYFLWDAENGNYESIGDHIPEPEVEFKLYYGEEKEDSDHNLFVSNFEVKSVGSPDPSWVNGGEIVEAHQQDMNNFAFGQYAACKRKAEAEQGFYAPFMLRYALRLYDGSYIMHSTPIVAWPAVDKNLKWSGSINGGGGDCTLGYCKLYYMLKTDYSSFADIVKSVDVFMTDFVDLYDTAKDAVWYGGTISHPGAEQGWRGFGNFISWQDGPVETDRNILFDNSSAVYTPKGFIRFKERSQVLKELSEASVFYKLCELGIYDNPYPVKAPIYSNTLQNITTQERLSDDFHSHAPLQAKVMDVYNARLHLGNIRRGFFDGFQRFALTDARTGEVNSGYEYRIQVLIKSESGKRVVEKRFTSPELIGSWFFYPDTRAYRAKVYIEDLTGPDEKLYYKEMPLKEHSGLNGSYYIAEPNITDTIIRNNSTVIHSFPETITDMEDLHNTFIQGEVNNPFIFKAEGYHTVGFGKIIGFSSQTVALSQGQFGAFPLLVFTTDGIWAMELKADGTYASGKPMSREVCNNPKSITQTDGAVFFSSAKGLIVVVGSEVKCVSEQLTTITAWLRDSIIAYDYRDSLLWIFNTANANRDCYIYSIKSGTFHRKEFGVVIHVVGNFPDTLIETSEGDVYSLLERPDINLNGETVGNVFTANTYTARMVTRALKFEDATGLKSIRQIRNVHDMQGQVRYRLFASNDLKSWRELKSLRGMPWKYYKMQFDFTGLRATDRFAGTVVVTQERRTNKLR